MKNIILLIAVSAFIVGCDNSPPNTVLQSKQSDVNVAITINNRIKIERLSIVEDSIAYGNERGTYLITDTVTGQEYIGISGIGISTLGGHSTGKSTISDER